MWLTLDLGNTTTKGGLFDGSELRRTFAIPADLTPDAAAWAEVLKPRLWDDAVTRIGVASVVPKRQGDLLNALGGIGDVPVLVVSHQLPLPVRMAYQTPRTLGTDRLAAALGAAAQHGFDGETGPRTLIVVDAGTAITYDVMRYDDEAACWVFEGGAIGAGPVLVRDSLRRGTAQLPEVEAEAPPSAIGRTTREALQAGILFGFLDAASGMLRRLRAELEADPYVVATGGWGSLLAEHLPVHTVDPHLVLCGIRTVMAHVYDTEATA